MKKKTLWFLQAKFYFLCFSGWPRSLHSLTMTAIFISSWLIISCLGLNAYAHDFENPENWHNPEITKFLRTSKVTDIKPMKSVLLEQGKKVEFDGQVFLVTLENEIIPFPIFNQTNEFQGEAAQRIEIREHSRDLQNSFVSLEMGNGIKAVFKSLPLDDQGDAQAEVAAYQASLYLGFPYIPPTVLREINGMKGSLQLFVNTPIDLLVDEEYTKALQKVSMEDLANLKIFYFVFGQWDSGAHNLLSLQNESKLYLIAIDNSGIRNHQYVHYGELPFVRILYNDKLNTNDWDKPFPFDNAQVIDEPSSENLKKSFGNKLPESFYKSFKSYGQPLKYVIYQNSLWKQYHAFDKSFIKSYVEKCPQKTLKTLQKLDLKILKEIFKSAKGADFLTDSYFKGILERRDQVLDLCNLKL